MRRKDAPRCFAICILLVALVATGADGATYHVKQDGTGDFTAIQEAIDAAEEGDTIIVHPGTFYENIHFNGKNITLRSIDPTDWDVVEATAIDGTEKDSVVTFAGTEDKSCVLSGFTITGGSGYTGGGIRGGDYLVPHTRATITKCSIVSNVAQRGGGIAHCDGRIAQCVIAGNRGELGGAGGIYDCRATITSCQIAANFGRGGGGGISNCNGAIMDCYVVDNEASGGGGLYKCDGAITRCYIQGNMASDGGGLYACNSDIRMCVVSENTAWTGGGLSSCSGSIVNCLITGNSAERYTCKGGGLYDCDGEILSCTVSDNRADAAGGGLYRCDGEIRNSIIWGNTAPSGPELYGRTPSYCCLGGEDSGGKGNIYADPLFADEQSDDYRLQAQSPCIDAGSSVGVRLNEDLDGRPRLINGAIDMGAYEFQGGLYVEVEAAREVYFGNETLILTIGGGNLGQTAMVDLYAAIEVPYGPLLYLPSLSTEPCAWFRQLSLPSGFHQEPFEAFSYTFSGLEPNGTYPIHYALVPSDPDASGINAVTSEFRYRRDHRTALQVNQDGSGDFLSIQEAVDTAIEGETILVHPGAYYENIKFRGANINLRSVDPENASVIASTVIDGRRKGSVVRFSGVEGDSCVLSGFTIVNGYHYDDGGGVHGADTLANITNCIFVDNWTASEGGAVYGCHGLIANCLMIGNTANEGGGLSSCYGLIFNCLIVENTAGLSGGGMSNCRGSIRSCTLTGNVAELQYGGGMAYCWTSVVNCIIWDNYAWYWPDLDDSGSPSYCLIGAWFEGGSNIVGRNPRFVTGPLGDYYLSRGSPCINAGYGSAEDAGLSDRTTQADGTPDTGVVDMGFHYPVP